MKFHVLLLGLLAGSPLVAAADAPSPARVQMEGFIAAFNTGDRARIETFGRDHMPPDFVRAAILDETIAILSGHAAGPAWLESAPFAPVRAWCAVDPWDSEPHVVEYDFTMNVDPPPN